MAGLEWSQIRQRVTFLPLGYLVCPYTVASLEVCAVLDCWLAGWRSVGRPVSRSVFCAKQDVVVLLVLGCTYLCTGCSDLQTDGCIVLVAFWAFRIVSFGGRSSFAWVGLALLIITLLLRIHKKKKKLENLIFIVREILTRLRLLLFSWLWLLNTIIF